MSGVVNSVGGFLGTSSGPQAPAYNGANSGLSTLTGQLQGAQSLQGQNAINQATQTGDVQSQLNNLGNLNLNSTQQEGLSNALATGATTGSDYATQQVQNNPLLSQGLNQIQGQLQTGQADQSQQQGILNNLQSQGFNLTPGDQSLYGQEAGQIANQYAQQGNQTANSLASRGLSSSGAAGAAFSGIAGNQNQQLADAQQQIAQQRFQNTQNQIAQQQNFIGQLNGQNNQAANNYSSQASGDINSQYQRQLQGATQSQGLATAASGQQQGANTAQNQYGLQSATFNAANTPFNIGDSLTSGVNSQIGQAFGGGGGLFGSSSSNSPASSKSSPSLGANTNFGSLPSMASMGIGA